MAADFIEVQPVVGPKCALATAQIITVQPGKDGDGAEIFLIGAGAMSVSARARCPS